MRRDDVVLDKMVCDVADGDDEGRARRYRQAEQHGRRRGEDEAEHWNEIADASKDGPESGAPAIVPAGMMGDRADVIFAAPEEISRMIEPRC